MRKQKALFLCTQKFQLARIDGDWKIVCKLFAYTGGEPPEGV